MSKPELLAPAGSWESLVAAVQNGADAVYLGGKSFNARYSAANFDDRQLIHAVEYCHTRGVKVYVTVNIIIADQELKEALKFLHFLHNIGVDAVIVQDLGLAKAAGELLPSLPLHASTQMTVHNTLGVKLLQQIGFERIVLSREMKLKDIAHIKQTTGADLEAFVHGALCVCYSGQCLMSSMIGGRSGNRGRCAQPCRMQYQLVDKQGRPLVDTSKVGEYLLSPRDINLSEHIPDLIDAGIDSFKIEGRMKRPEYVATVIRIYRELIDRALDEKQTDKLPGFQQKKDLEQIFNRDFSTGYFYGNPGRDLMSYKRPNNRGVLIGRVKRYSKDSDLVELTLQEPLRVGDGIEVWVTQGGRTGTEVHRLIVKGKQVDEAAAGSTVWVPIPGKVRPGDRVFKTHDAELINRAKITYTSSRETRKIPLQFTVRAAVGQPLFMRVEDAAGFAAEASSEELGQKAEKRPLTEEFLQKQLDRLGNTPFALSKVYCELQGEVMFPVRVINDLRRKVLDELEKKRQQTGLRPAVDQKKFNADLERYFNASTAAKFKHPGTKPKLAVNVAGYDSLRAAVNAGADIVYFGGESYRSRKAISLSDIQRAGELCSERDVEFILSTPRIMQDDELNRFAKFLEQAVPYAAGVLIGNLGLLKLFAENYRQPMIADFPLNVFNRITAVRLRELNIKRVTLSPELTMSQIKEFAHHQPLPLEAVVHGALPLMVSEYCALGSLMGGLTSENKCDGPCRNVVCGLKDRKGVIFPIEVDQFCHQHIFNSKELCLIDDAAQLADAGVAVLRIDARTAGADRTRRLTEAYRKVLDIYPLKEWQSAAEALKAELEKGSTGFTKGHYYRGVI